MTARCNMIDATPTWRAPLVAALVITASVATAVQRGASPGVEWNDGGREGNRGVAREARRRLASAIGPRSKGCTSSSPDPNRRQRALNNDVVLAASLPVAIVGSSPCDHDEVTFAPEPGFVA